MYIPAILILNKAFGFEGLIFAMPLADTLTTILSTTMLVWIVRRLRHPKAQEILVNVPIPEA
jgi:Na+-driven multidrug efflux pump